MPGSKAPEWRTSSHSEGDACVEVADGPDGVRLRDSKDPDGPVLAFDAEDWTAFIAGVRRGDFDRS
jgi:hypothetical protein